MTDDEDGIKVDLGNGQSVCINYPECPPGSTAQFPDCATPEQVCFDPDDATVELACDLAATCQEAAGTPDAQACVDALVDLIPVCAPGQMPGTNGCVLPSQASCALDFEPTDCPAQVCALDGALGPACALVSACDDPLADTAAACIAALGGLAPPACEQDEDPSPPEGCVVPYDVACFIDSQSPDCVQDPCEDPDAALELPCAIRDACPDAAGGGAGCIQFVRELLPPPCSVAPDNPQTGECILPDQAACVFDYDPSDCAPDPCAPGSPEPVLVACALVAACPDADGMGEACLDALLDTLPDPCTVAEGPDGECLVPEEVLCVLEGGEDCAPAPCDSAPAQLEPACLVLETCGDAPADMGAACIAILGALLPSLCGEGDDPEEDGCVQVPPPECEDFPPQVDGPEDRCLPTAQQAQDFAAQAVALVGGQLTDGNVMVCAAIVETPAWAALVENDLCPDIDADEVSLFEPDADGEASAAEVTVRLNIIPSDEVTLTLTLPDGAAGELELDTTELTIDPDEDCDDEAGCEATFTATALDDGVDDPDAILDIAIEAEQADGGLYDGLEVDPIQVTVKDDELPVLSVRPILFGAEQGAVAGKFRFERASEDRAAALLVCFDVLEASTATVEGTGRDVNGMPPLQASGACNGHRQFTIPAVASSTELTLPTVDDAEIEEAETVFVRLFAVASYAVQRSTAIIEIVDNDLPVLSISASDSRAGEQSRDPGRITVTRTGGVDDPLTVLFTVSGTAGATDYERTPAVNEITIPAGSRSALLAITPFDDASEEPSESVLVTLAASELYFRDTVFQASVLIVDNDGRNAPQPVNPISDRDGDGVRNAEDNCPDLENPTQSNQDGDLLGDECDPTPLPPPDEDDEDTGGEDDGEGEGDDDVDLLVDTDGDGLTDEEEQALGTDADREDSDGDGLSDKREIELGTDPTGRDSDDDGVSDGAEVLGVRNGGEPTDPLDPTDATVAAEGFAARPAFYVGLALTLGIVAALAIGIAGFVSRRP